MDISVYNGEKFHRTKLRYAIFAAVFASIFILSILSNNIVGAVLLFFLLGGYFYYSTVNNQIVKMRLENNALLVGDKTFPRSHFTGYVIEIHSKSQEPKNIVLVTSRSHHIYSFDDELAQIHDFANALSNYLPMLEGYAQTGLEKFARKLKL